MRTLKLIKIDGNDFEYSLEPGAEVLGLATQPYTCIVTLCDPNEPSTVKHRFISVGTNEDMESLELSDYKIKPEEALIYIGVVASGNKDFVVFEVLE